MAKKSIKQLKFIDLFAGIGGFRIALESFGEKCIFSSEWDKNCQEIYNTNFQEKPKGDITQIKEKNIPRHDILCAGFPCQPFSISGKQKGLKETRGTLFFDIVRIAKYHKPQVVFLENVKNFEKHDKGKTLKVVLNALDEIGYKVYYKVLNSSHFGQPTTRERIYIVGFKKNIDSSNFKFPDGSRKETILKDLLEKNVSKSFYINREDIKLKKKEETKPLFKNYPQKPIRVGTINKGGQGERIYSIYGHTITLSSNGGGIASKTGAYLVNNKIRKLTPRECARVMGFPEDFIIHSSSSQAYKQFGNSVVIPVIKDIYEEIIKIIKK